MKRLLLPILLLCSVATLALTRLLQVEPFLNSTGKAILPANRGVKVGSYPVQMKLSPDGRWLVVTNTGFRQQLSVIDTRTGTVTATQAFNGKAGDNKESLYWGLDVVGKELYVSRGPEDKVSVYNLNDDGSLTFKRDVLDPARSDATMPNFVSGVLCTSDAIYALNNETGPSTSWRGTVSEIDPSTGAVRGKIAVGGFPLSIVGGNGECYVSSEQDGLVSYFRPGARIADSIRVGANPTAMVMRGTRLYVSNSSSDTVSVIDTATHNVVGTILLRPVQARALPTCTPLGIDLSPDGSRLYVALADMNAVAVVDTAASKVLGYIPVGWYPTDVKVSKDGAKLFVANAKGVDVRIPNGKPVDGHGTYIQNIIEGTVSMLSVKAVDSQLAEWSRSVLTSNRLNPEQQSEITRRFSNPGIKHVIYIVKENRTYDNVLGDMPGGDPSLCLFPREVTPNQHALADRFVLLDNFYCCAEVSGDGWNWSTAGAANEYVSRNVPFNYSGRGRDYDFEGEVNGGKPEQAEVNNVAAPPGGYIWDNARKRHVSMRNYGFFVGESDQLGVRPGTPQQKVMAPVLKALEGVTDPDFNQFDMAYPDSDLTRAYGFAAPKELEAFGVSRAKSRFDAWKSEFDGYVKKGSMPALQLVRFCRDHTSGTAAGRLSPRAMVADNDYAVGQLVEAVSHSKFWKDTVILIVEDDAQSGLDHVDCHRSIAFAISPFIQKGTRDSHFYNTDGVLRTMELLLGMPPMNGFDGVADPFFVFSSRPDNSEPYTAIKPSEEIATQVNKPGAYRGADSARINRFGEDSEMDEQLNDILWGAIKGKWRQP